MGLFDTIILDKEIECPVCKGKIASVQTKDFGSLLYTYRVGDCISHSDDIRIAKEELYCSTCMKFPGKSAYIVVERGILTGTVETLAEAKSILGTLNIERLVPLYHSAYRKRVSQANARQRLLGFLDELCEWYEKELDKKETEAPKRKIVLFKEEFEGIDNPLEALREYVEYEKLISAINDLEEAGQTVLNVYYREKIEKDADVWSVDVGQDEISKICGCESVRTVVSQKYLDLVEAKKKHSRWTIVVEKPFSDQAVLDAIESWLRDRGFNFEVRMTAPPG